MKYIRTKDNIYELSEKKLDPCGEIFRVKVKNNFGFDEIILKNEIIKQADTIEDLCDEYVLENIYDIKYAKKVFIYQNKIDESIIELVKEKSINFYGAIWTECGLKYVAKMNLNGELELLW